MRQVIVVGCVVWAAVGAAIAFASLGEVNDDAIPIVVVASVLGPLSAVVGAWLVDHGCNRAAGAALLVSVVTPTFFAYVVNVPALVAGALLLLAPGTMGTRQA